jgi:hypothetical protein
VPDELLTQDQKCGAELHIGDDHGDNQATMTCGLSPGHECAHREVYPRGDLTTFVTVEWFGDDTPQQVECSGCKASGSSNTFMVDAAGNYECTDCWCKRVDAETENVW